MSDSEKYDLAVLFLILSAIGHIHVYERRVERWNRLGKWRPRNPLRILFELILIFATSLIVLINFIALPVHVQLIIALLTAFICAIDLFTFRILPKAVLQLRHSILLAIYQWRWRLSYILHLPS